MIDIILLTILFTMGLLIGISKSNSSDNEILKKFPLCIEKEVGLSKVKKCYEIKEIP